MDVGITAEHFCLQAAEEGLGTCWIGWFNEKQVKKMLKLPGNSKVNIIIALGYAADENKRKKVRKSLESIRSYIK